MRLTTITTRKSLEIVNVQGTLPASQPASQGSRPLPDYRAKVAKFNGLPFSSAVTERERQGESEGGREVARVQRLSPGPKTVAIHFHLTYVCTSLTYTQS